MATTKTEIDFTKNKIDITAIDGENKAVASYDSKTSEIIENATKITSTADDKASINSQAVDIHGDKTIKKSITINIHK